MTVLGYHNGDGRLHQPACRRRAAPVYIASDELLTKVLSKADKASWWRAPGQPARVSPADTVPVALDVRAFTSTHMAIIASTGSGKDYLAGVLLEEVLMPYNRASVLIIDPPGEYGTLQKMQDLKQFSTDDCGGGAHLPPGQHPRAHRQA